MLLHTSFNCGDWRLDESDCRQKQALVRRVLRDQRVQKSGKNRFNLKQTNNLDAASSENAQKIEHLLAYPIS